LHCSHHAKASQWIAEGFFALYCPSSEKLNSAVVTGKAPFPTLLNLPSPPRKISKNQAPKKQIGNDFIYFYHEIKNNHFS